MGKLQLGKIPIHLLDSTVLRLTGAGSDKVVTPATAGVDFAAVKLVNGFMIVSADPITGVSEKIGELAVKVSANDVATSGTAPKFAESVVLMPEGATTSDLEKIATQIHDAALEIGVAILGGHTEVTPGLKRPIVVVTVFGFADDFVTSAGARDGDLILMTKTAAIEGTAELAREYHFPVGAVAPSTLKSARRFMDKVDVTKEAVAAYRTGRIHAMHDCTEGGVIGAAYEMSHASGVGFVLDEAAVPIARETAELCDKLSVNPLLLIGSGSLLIAVEKGGESKVKRALKPICRVTRIGEFREGPRIILKKDGSKKRLKGAPQDELWRMFGRTPRSRNRA